jgi:hypothetical protein
VVFAEGIEDKEEEEEDEDGAVEVDVEDEVEVAFWGGRTKSENRVSCCEVERRGELLITVLAKEESTWMLSRYLEAERKQAHRVSSRPKRAILSEKRR